VNTYKKRGDAKIGDLVAINDHEFLIIKQGKSKDKKLTNLIYKFDISSADDLTTLKKMVLSLSILKMQQVLD